MTGSDGRRTGPSPADEGVDPLGDCQTSPPLPFPRFDDEESHDVRVLLVDDDAALRDVVGTYLERSEAALSVVSEESAEAGLTRIESEEVDCIVSDYDMAGPNGLEFLEMIRDAFGELPFILFTGKGSEEIASEAIAAGVTDYMQKGFGTDQYEVLANRIVNAVEVRRAERERWAAFTWYRRLVEQNLAGIYVIQDEEFVYVNEKFAEIFGFTQEALVGTSPFEIVDERHHDVLRENVEKRELGEVESIEYSLRGKRRDGSRFDVTVHGGSIELRGRPAVMGVLVDDSER